MSAGAARDVRRRAGRYRARACRAGSRRRRRARRSAAGARCCSSLACARSRRVDVATAFGMSSRFEPVEELEQPGLERDAVARDDRVVGDVPRAHEVGGRKLGAVAVDDDRLRNPGSCGRPSTAGAPGRTRRRCACAASAHARGASRSVSSMSPSMSKITARRRLAARASSYEASRAAPVARPAQRAHAHAAVRVADRAGERVGGIGRRRARQAAAAGAPSPAPAASARGRCPTTACFTCPAVYSCTGRPPARPRRSRRRAPGRAAASSSG